MGSGMWGWMVLAGLAGLVLGAAVAAGYYRPRLSAFESRVAHLARGAEHTNEMLQQARRQAEALQQQLEHARRHRTVPESPVLPVGPNDPSASIVVDGKGFADTQVLVRGGKPADKP